MQSDKDQSKDQHSKENPLRPKEKHQKSPEMPENPPPSDKEPVPRNPLGLPEDYPPFGSHIRTDFVYPPDIGPGQHVGHHKQKHPDVPDMGQSTGGLLGPDNPYFHRHQKPESPFPPPFEGAKEGNQGPNFPGNQGQGGTKQNQPGFGSGGGPNLF